jgi:hypothetical protein
MTNIILKKPPDIPSSASPALCDIPPPEVGLYPYLFSRILVLVYEIILSVWWIGLTFEKAYHPASQLSHPSTRYTLLDNLFINIVS